MQTLNGVQAVSYARIRYTAGDDYKRAERQRRVLTEMIKKAKSASLTELNSLINTVFPQISTDLDKKDIISMATVMIKYDMANSGGFPYSKDTFTPSKSIGSVVAPCDLESNVIELHKRLYGTDNYTPSETVKKYSEHIVDVSGYTAEWKADNRFSGQDEFFGNGTQTTDDGPVQRRIQQNDAFVHLPGMRVDAYCFKTGFCGMFQMQRCDDAAGEIGIYSVCQDVGTGTNGLCRQLDVYPSEKEQIENRSPCREICVGIF